MQSRQKRKGPLVFAELAVNPEIRTIRRKIAPQRIAQVRVRRDFAPQRRKVEPRAFRRKQIFAQRICAAGSNTIGIDAAFVGTPGDRARRDDDLRRAQHVIVKRLELRMVPQPPRIASCHAHHVWQAGDLSREISRDSIGLHVMRENDVEGLCGMRARSDACELRDERARHRDIGLRAVDWIGPMHRDGAFAERSLAAFPVLLPHMHPERRERFLRVRDHVNLVAACREAMRGPIGAHAYATLNGRKFTDNANSHPRTSMRPARARSAISASVSGTSRKSAASTQPSSAANRSKTAGGSSKMPG